MESTTRPQLPTQFRIGACSWKYPSWEGLVYSRPKGINYLQEYSRQYNTVEIDQWFWSLFAAGNGNKTVKLPDKTTVEEYAQSTPKDFTFTVKAPNSLTLTHPYKQKDTPNPHFLSPVLYDRFLEAIEPIIQKTECIMLQFEYLNRTKMPSLDLFLEKINTFINAAPRDIPLGLEIRNPGWLGKKYFKSIKEMSVFHVFLQGYYMKPVQQIYFNGAEDYIDRYCVIRLHGNDRPGIENETSGKWDTIVRDKTSDMKEISKMVHRLLKKNAGVTVNLNNHYEGSAPRSIERFKNILFGSEDTTPRKYIST